jgi:monothiol glutaredoxin
MRAMSTPDPTAAAQRPLLPASRISSEALAHMSTFHADILEHVQREVSTKPLVVVGMAQNPHVRNVRKALARAGVAFEYIEYGSYLSKWRERLAIKLWSGWPTFPQVFVKGALLGGEDLTLAALENGTLRRLLEE